MKSWDKYCKEINCKNLYYVYGCEANCSLKNGCEYEKEINEIKRNEVENKEERYFISYVAYAYNNEKDFFNNIVIIDKEISVTLIEEIQDKLLSLLNENKAKKVNRIYYATQIIGLTHI